MYIAQRKYMFLVRRKTRHGILCERPSFTGSEPARMSSTSALLAEGCCSGVSRNQKYQAAHQSMPSTPHSTNGRRQPCLSISQKTMKGVAVAPSAWPMQTAPIARPRCAAGNQRETVEALFGIAPASPAPKSMRTTKSDAKPKVAAVSIVKADHQSTMRVSALRVPKRSPNQPEGTSKSAYAKVKALKM